jgi:hypothetical protein
MAGQSAAIATAAVQNAAARAVDRANPGSGGKCIGDCADPLYCTGVAILADGAGA